MLKCAGAGRVTAGRATRKAPRRRGSAGATRRLFLKAIPVSRGWPALPFRRAAPRHKPLRGSSSSFRPSGCGAAHSARLTVATAVHPRLPGICARRRSERRAAHAPLLPTASRPERSGLCRTVSAHQLRQQSFAPAMRHKQAFGIMAEFMQRGPIEIVGAKKAAARRKRMKSSPRDKKPRRPLRGWSRRCR